VNIINGNVNIHNKKEKGAKVFNLARTIARPSYVRVAA